MSDDTFTGEPAVCPYCARCEAQGHAVYCPISALRARIARLSDDAAALHAALDRHDGAAQESITTLQAKIKSLSDTLRAVRRLSRYSPNHTAEAALRLCGEAAEAVLNAEGL